MAKIEQPQYAGTSVGQTVFIDPTLWTWDGTEWKQDGFLFTNSKNLWPWIIGALIIGGLLFWYWRKRKKA
jgi:LPXTG-motif cell wall-anchored protein